MYFHGIITWVFSPVKNKKGGILFFLFHQWKIKPPFFLSIFYKFRANKMASRTWSIFSEESVVIRDPIFPLDTV